MHILFKFQVLTFADCKQERTQQNRAGNSTAGTNEYLICSMCFLSENIYHVITFI